VKLTREVLDVIDILEIGEISDVSKLYGCIDPGTQAASSEI
jgi:hypothetical protein